MFVHRDHVEGDLPRGLRVEVAFTGVGLDLAEGSPDRDAGLDALQRRTGTPLVRMRQVHGARVHLVDDGDLAGPDAPTEADALVTTRPGVGLLARVADCVPVLLADAGAGVLGAVHSGRRGTCLDIATGTVAAMRAAGADDIVAWVGPHICGRCYEVPEAMRDEVAARVPAASSTTRWGTPGLDLGAGVTAQLEASGCTVRRVDRCTFEQHDLPSFRRDATAVRCAGVVWSTAA